MLQLISRWVFPWGGSVMFAWLALTMCSTGPALNEPRTPLLVVTDGEMDDYWALTHLALSPRINLRGVVATLTSGRDPRTPERTVEALRKWLGRLPVPYPIPVEPGSARPLSARDQPNPNAGVDLLLRELRRGTQDQRVVVALLGSATDLASALLTDPSLAQRAEVVAMAFDRWPEGGDPWNVKNDLDAWRVVLDASWPIVVGDADIGARFLTLASADAHTRFDPCGPSGRHLVERLDSWLDDHAEHAVKTTGAPRSWPIWDEVVVAHLLGLTEVEVLPRPTLRDDRTFDHKQTRPRGTLRWVRSVRADTLWNDLALRLRAD